MASIWSPSARPCSTESGATTWRAKFCPDPPARRGELAAAAFARLAFDHIRDEAAVDWQYTDLGPRYREPIPASTPPGRRRAVTPAPIEGKSKSRRRLALLETTGGRGRNERAVGDELLPAECAVERYDDDRERGRKPVTHLDHPCDGCWSASLGGQARITTNSDKVSNKGTLERLLRVFSPISPLHDTAQVRVAEPRRL